MKIIEWIVNPASFIFSSIPAVVVLLFAAALVLSATGFYRLVYFISIGYGFSIAGMAIISAVVFNYGLTWFSVLHASLLAVYGLRLGLFLLRREFQASYKKEQEEIQKEYPARKVVLKLAIWITVSLLYVIMVSPLVFHLEAVCSPVFSTITIVGLIAGFAGLGIEAAADFQKSAFKKKYPARFCDSGLYRVVRSPNYFGEILVWLGSFLAAIPFYGNDLWRWIFAATGLAVIILIMLGSAKRLEAKQEERYGADIAFKEYCRRTPILFPLVPIKSLKKLKVYLG
ncbi:MAG: DUF1295 domain-containing protein [Spirochaetales bacterium]|nr:DUF1295 domain-containing protein [Spirochaetales bacterium]